MADRLGNPKIRQQILSQALRGGSDDPIVNRILREQEERRRLEEEEAGRRRWENVQSAVSSTERLGPAPVEEPRIPYGPAMGLRSILDEVLKTGGATPDALEGGAKRELGAALFTANDLNEEDTGTGVSSFVLSSLISGLVPGAGLVINEAKNLSPEFKRDLGRQLYTTGGEQVRSAEDQAGLGRFGTAVVDVVSQPSSLASIAGGPLGAAAGGATAFNQTYTESRLGGLDKADASLRAGGSAALEGAISAIPAGQVIDRLTGGQGSRLLNSFLRGQAQNIIGRTAKVSLGEGLEESTTEALQLGWDKFLSENASSEEARQFSEGQLAQDIWGVFDRVSRAGLAGALGGGAIGGTMASLQDTAEAGKLVADTLASTSQDAERRKMQEQARQAGRYAEEAQARMQEQERRAAEPTQPSLFPNLVPDTDLTFEQQEAQRQEELTRDAGFTVAERQQSEERARVREIAYLEREKEQIRANSSQATLDRDLARTREIDSQLEQLRTPVQETAPTAAPTEQRAPVQTSFLQPVGPEANAGEMARRRKLVEEAKTQQTKELATQRKQASSARASARRTFISNFRTANRSLPAGELANRQADAVMQWEAQNPIDNFVKPIAEPTTRGKKGKKGKAPVKEKMDLGTMLSRIEQMQSGLSSRAGSAEVTDVTPTRAVNALVKGIASGDNRKLAKMLVDKKLEIVEDVNTIPSGAVPSGTAGYYDGNKMYVVANRLNEGTEVAQMLEIVAHESTHAGDVAKLNSALVGNENNSRWVRRVQELAKTDEGIRTNVVERAKADEEGVQNLETIAYFVNEMRNRRADKGAAGRLYQNLKSAMKVRANKMLGTDFELTENDVAYLSDKLLEEVAVTDKSISGDVEQVIREYGTDTPEGVRGLAMYISGGTGEVMAIKEGRTYLSVDGKRKYEISDADSKLTFDLQPQEGNTYKLGDIMRHEELYKEFPQLRDLTVVIGPRDLEFGGSYSNGQITIPINEIDDVDDINRTGNPVHLTMLHEVQHAAQDIAGSTPGTNPYAMMSAKGKALLRQITGAEQALAAGKALGADTTVMENELNKIRNEYSKEYNEAVAKYLDVLGEAEARSTAARMDMTLEERLEDTIDQGRTFEDKYAARGNQRILNARGNNLLAGDKRSRIAEGRRQRGLAMSAEVTQEDVDAETGGFDRTSIEDLGSTAVKTHADRVMERLLWPGGFRDAELKELLQFAQRLPASMSLRAHHLTNELRDAIEANWKTRKKEAYKQGKASSVNLEGVRKEIGDRLNKVDALPTLDERRSAIAAIERDYPGVGKAFNALRAFKLEQTKNIILLRAKDPRPLSDMEENIYRKMLENAERYTTRAYLATYDDEIGDSYGKRMINQFHKNPKSEEAKTVQTALDWLVNNELTIPDEETLRGKKISEIRRLHENWIGPSANFKKAEGKEQMIQNLLNMNPKSKKEVDQKAYEIVLDMLGQNEQKGATAKAYTPSMRQNRTILEARTDIPEPLRKLLGEITDPLLKEAISLNRMINLQAKTRFLTEAFERGENTWWSNTKSDKFGIKLDNVAYGPLDGKYVSKDMEDAITGTVLSMQGIDAMMGEITKDADLVMKLAGGAALGISRDIMSAQKSYGVVANFWNGVVNLIGAAAMMAPMNGMFPGSAATREGIAGAYRVLRLDVSNRNISERTLEQGEELLLAGVTDSATMNDLRGNHYDGIRNELSKLGSEDRMNPAKVAKTAWKWAIGQHKVGDAIRTAYAFMDVWVKSATYYDRKAFNTKMNELEGWGLTQEEIIRKSGMEASGTNVSYERAVPLAKILERNIPAFMFLTYKTETVRATATSFIQAYQDFKTAAEATNPEAKALAFAQGTKRMVGTSAVLAAWIGGTLAALDSEDEDEKKKRELDYPWMKNVIQIKLGKDKNGNDIILNFNRFDPLGPQNEFMTAIANAPEGEKEEAAVQAVGDFIFAKSSGFMAFVQLLSDATVAQVMPELDMKVKGELMVERNAPALYEFLQTIPADLGVNAANVIEKTFTPGSVRPWIDDKGEVPGFWNDMPRTLGMTTYVRDPNKLFVGKVIEHKEELTRLREDLKELRGRSNTTIDDLMELRDREYEIFDRLSRSYDGYLAFDGTKRSDAVEIIGNKTLAQQLRTGEFKSSLLDRQALDEWKNKELKKPGADKEQIKETHRRMKELYRELR